MVIPSWVFSPGSALAQPAVSVSNKRINKIYKMLLSRDKGWTHHVDFERGVDDYIRRFRIYEIIEDEAENRIRQLMDRGI